MGNSCSGTRILIGKGELTLEAIVAVARGAQVELYRDPEFIARIERGARRVDEHWRNSRRVYGVTTGVGEACVREIPENLVKDFSRNLARFHGCGLGRRFEPDHSLAIMAARLASLVRGYSGVRFQLLERLELLINHRVCPLIPSEGSVGASGDLTPLSYVAALLMGERDVWYDGKIQSAERALASLGLEPLALEPKEGLAIMNGTSVMGAIACLAFDRARYLSALTSRATALVSFALRGNKAHFDPRIFASKPHPGQAASAALIAADLGFDSSYRHPEGQRIQDTYAVRCAPHVIGVLEDALPWVRSWLEIELNGSNDNPLIEPESGDVLHGGNFYGGHVAFAMDALKTAVANLADLLDRQMALLVDERRNNGLPANLSGATAERLPVNHCFKALHIATSAWAAEALKLTMPASVFSRSTESHNQDKVSMGTIAARDCIRVLELTEQVLVSVLIAGVQGMELRQSLDGTRATDELLAFRDVIRTISPFIEEDRPLEAELRILLDAIRDKRLPLRQVP